MSDIVRVTGTAEEPTVRTGTSNPGTPQARDWEMWSQVIRTNEFVALELSLKDQSSALPAGQPVDLIVEAKVRGSRINYEAQGVWPTEGSGRRAA